jgi:hypothetical protein
MFAILLLMSGEIKADVAAPELCLWRQRPIHPHELFQHR